MIPLFIDNRVDMATMVIVNSVSSGSRIECYTSCVLDPSCVVAPFDEAASQWQLEAGPLFSECHINTVVVFDAS